jgi:hypothetical protein
MVVLTDVRAGRPASDCDVDAVVHEEEYAGFAARRCQRRREWRELVIGELRSAELHRSSAALDSG